MRITNRREEDSRREEAEEMWIAGQGKDKNQKLQTYTEHRAIGRMVME